ncbi:MAG TPA: WbqC family protein [Puia sp.]|nr:WbqC family protein [Puia sp.]
MDILIDIEYFASYISYKNVYKSSYVRFEQYETWQKAAHRNRCLIAGANGTVGLSVPLDGGRDQRVLVRDIRISGRHRWQAQHWKTIVSCYSRSPWFDHYRVELEGFYRRNWTFLLDWNLACFDWSMRALGIQRPAGLTAEWKLDYGPDLLDVRRVKTDAGMVAGMEEGTGKRMKERGDREVDEGVTRSSPRYRQVFEERTGFIPGLSILDLLFCTGPQAIRYIQ